jgi:hypothetical protein
MRGLSNTVGEGDGFRTVMACHYSQCGAESACIGYVHVEGYSNLNVRIMVAKGELDILSIDRECADLDLWDSFHEMLAAYEEAQ